MAEVAAHALSFNDRHHFAIRRLHSLTGIIPIGAFLCVHLSINASILAGPGAFQFAVDLIHKLDRLGILKIVEVGFIILPIVFHGLVGLVIWLSGRTNVTTYPYWGNARYALQRWTGIIAMLFILAHLWHVHWIIPGGGEFDPHAAAYSAVAAMRGGWVAPVYLLGVLAAVYHLANGLWTFLIVWGVTIGPRGQRVSGGLCVALAIILGTLGVGALLKLKTMDPAALSDTTQGANVGAADDAESERV